MLQSILEKNALKKYDLQESYNNFKIKLDIYFCESKGPWLLVKIYCTVNESNVWS